jgi:hypothetical protein
MKLLLWQLWPVFLCNFLQKLPSGSSFLLPMVSTMLNGVKIVFSFFRNVPYDWQVRPGSRNLVRKWRQLCC